MGANPEECSSDDEYFYHPEGEHLCDIPCDEIRDAIKDLRLKGIHSKYIRYQIHPLLVKPLQNS